MRFSRFQDFHKIRNFYRNPSNPIRILKILQESSGPYEIFGILWIPEIPQIHDVLMKFRISEMCRLCFDFDRKVSIIVLQVPF